LFCIQYNFLIILVNTMLFLQEENMSALQRNDDDDDELWEYEEINAECHDEIASKALPSIPFPFSIFMKIDRQNLISIHFIPIPILIFIVFWVFLIFFFSSFLLFLNKHWLIYDPRVKQLHFHRLCLLAVLKLCDAVR